MRVRMVVRRVNIFAILAGDEKWQETWEEDFDTKCHCLADEPKGKDAKYYAQKVVDYFNATLKPGEFARELITARRLKKDER